MTQQYIAADDLYNIVTLSEPRFSPDGQWLAYVRSEVDREENAYRSAIWLVPTAGGRPRAFTNGEKRDRTPRWSPDGRWLAFVSDRGGEKAKPQVYLIPTDGGEARPLTRMENGADEAAWSPDGTRLAFRSRLAPEEMAAEDNAQPDSVLEPGEAQRRTAKEEKQEREKADPRVIKRFRYRAETDYFDDRTGHLYVLEVDLETGEAAGKPRRLTADERDYSNPRWMPDGAALLATVNRKPGEDDLFYHPDVVRIPLDGAESEILTGPGTADENPRPSPDGRWIAYSSRPGDELSSANAEIKLIPASGGDAQTLTTGLDAHATDHRWAPGSNSVLFLVPERGRIDLRRVSLRGGSVETVLTADREILAYDLSPDGQRAGFVASTDRAPWDLYVASLDGSADQRLTEVNAPWLNGRTLADVEDLWFESTDATPIQGWIIKPPGFDSAINYPLILSIHGGPHVMWSRHEPTMWHEWQMQAARGYVVFACNPRGSDGYGYSFRVGALNNWGEADLPDLMAGVDRVVARGYVDPERLVVTGGSYGGFMTAWIIGHETRFRAAVAQRGVYDLFSFYGTTDIPRFAEREFFNTPWENPQHVWNYSPLAYVERMRTPLLLIHSTNDFRVPIPVAEGLFTALRRLKRTVEMVCYPRDGHELSRSGEPKHRVDRLERIVDWFEKYI